MAKARDFRDFRDAMRLLCLLIFHQHSRTQTPAHWHPHTSTHTHTQQQCWQLGHFGAGFSSHFEGGSATTAIFVECRVLFV